MEIKTAKEAGIKIAGSSIRTGGQIIVASKNSFEKALVSSVKGDSEAQEEALEKKLDMPDLWQYRKLPSWKKRHYLRKLNAQKAQEEFFAGPGTKQIFYRTGSAGGRNATAGIPQPAPGTSQASQTAAASGKQIAAVKLGEDAAAKTSVALKAGGNAIQKGGSVAIKGGSTAAKAGAAASGAATAGATTAAMVAAEGAAQAVKAAKKAADKIRSDLTALMAEHQMQIRLASAAKGQEKGKSKKDETSGLPFILALLAIGIILVLFISIPIAVFMDQPQQYPAVRYEHIVEAAKKELALSESTVGGYKYKNWYGMDDNWCAMFVSYCANQCGYIESGIMPKTASVAVMREWYEARRLFHGAVGYTPQPGDIIIFGNGKSHTGIIISYDPDTQMVTTIEGNTGRSDATPYHTGSRVEEHSYALSYAYIAGYASPEYPQEESTQVGDNTTEEEPAEDNVPDSGT